MRNLKNDRNQSDVNNLSSRRSFLKYGLTVAVASQFLGKAMAATLSAPKDNLELSIENFAANGKSEGVMRVNKVIKSDADWRKSLPNDSYEITRLAGTEAPYTGKYWNNHANGIYRCVCCDTALYDSKTKL